MISKEEILFPHSSVREVQGDLIKEVVNVLENKKHLIAHAPTGLGKTAATIPIALSFALKNDLTIFFLTSRHTQHNIAIDTLKSIKKRHGTEIISTDIIGKKWMCAQLGVDALYSNEFAEYCKKLREENSCEYYSNVKKKSGSVTVKAKAILEDLRVLSPCHSDKIFEVCNKEKLCPYEMAALLAKESKIIIADYNYIFNPGIRNAFFLKSQKELQKCIVIVDEAHNLPRRVRELLTAKLSNFILERAIKEAKKFGFNKCVGKLRILLDMLNELSIDLDEKNQEKIIRKNELIQRVNFSGNYDDMINDLTFAGDDVREKQKQSYTALVASFLEFWTGEDEGYARILSKKMGKYGWHISLNYNCLDPSFVTKDIVDNVYSMILMSGTLTPTFMYKDILGFDDAVEKEFSSPFPKKNRLSLIIPETTTKYTRRGKEEFAKIAERVAGITNLVPGNSLVFFPSYFLRDSVYMHLMGLKTKELILEKSGLSKDEKNELLDTFRSKKEEGAVLLGVSSGNFGEGIDLAGDLLKAVIVVGLPLQRPSLDVKELIDYYDKKFSKGWEYGYVFPAIIKVLQNAGRCIRSSEDKGVIVFLDERFAWENYYKCFPADYDVKISKLYEERVKGFFGKI